ncbi:MAG: threonine synthase [Chloroflexi bacterium]|nr:threonine synthase [Chloroflexota bacterium]
MAQIKELRCCVCGRTYTPGTVQYVCPACGEIGTLDVLYDYEQLQYVFDRETFTSTRPGMWRYKVLLPIAPSAKVPPLPVGGTPLYDSPRLAKALGVRRAWVKDDGRNPTASLKDRASSLVVAKAMETGVQIVSAASTGNAAAALAGIGASVGLRIIIFVPATAPEAKIAQLAVYGAEVLLVEASYDTAFDLCFTLSQQEGWLCRNTGINPFTTEGKKTVSFEIAETLHWEVPDVLVTSVGDGNIIAGVYKGFWDLLQLGWIERIPRLVGVQASGCAPLVEAWKTGANAVDMEPIQTHTIADSIVAALPRDRAKALRAVRQTDGAFVAVSDEEILESIPQLARLTGVFAEPAAAASFAGAHRAVKSGVIHPEESVALLITGNGLKDIRSAQSAVSGGQRVPPDLEAIRKILHP